MRKPVLVFSLIMSMVFGAFVLDCGPVPLQNSETIVRRVRVDRSLTPQQVLDATGRSQYTIKSMVVESMPRGEGDEKDVYFFKLDRYATDDEIEQELALRGFKPADLYSLAQVNIDDPSFPETHPNATHWKDGLERWCFAAFGRWEGRRDVNLDRDDSQWDDYWWFAGIRKSR